MKVYENYMHGVLLTVCREGDSQKFSKDQLSKLFDLSEKDNFTVFQNFLLSKTRLVFKFEKQVFFVFLISLTHIFLCLWYAFLYSSDLLLRNFFLNFDLTMIPFLSSLFINDVFLALTYFFLRGAKLFQDVKRTF